MSSRKKKEPTDLSSSLQELFTRKNWSTLWQTYALVRKWPEIVGKNIAKKSEPAYIQNDTLWVYVQSSVLMQHMQPQKLTLLDKINSILPEADIHDIRWAMQPAKPASKAKESVRKAVSRSGPEERNAFEAMASTVEDKKCREALKSLWRTFHNS